MPYGQPLTAFTRAVLISFIPHDLLDPRCLACHNFRYGPRVGLGSVDIRAAACPVQSFERRSLKSVVDNFGELLRQVRQGDPQAAATLIGLYESELRVIARVRLNDPRLR